MIRKAEKYALVGILTLRFIAGYTNALTSSLTVVRNKNSETPWKWWGSEFTSTF